MNAFHERFSFAAEPFLLRNSLPRGACFYQHLYFMTVGCAKPFVQQTLSIKERERFMASGIIEIRTSNPPPRETEFIPHSHPELEIGYFKSGHGIYSVKGRKYEIHAGDVFFFNNDELHKVTTVYPDEPMHTVALLFQPRLVWDTLTDDFTRDCLDVFRNRDAAFSHRLDRSFDAYEHIVSLILDAEREWKECRPFYLKMVKSRILEILITVSRNRNAPHAEEKPPALFKDVLHLINAAVDDIEETFCEDISIAALAAKYGMSQNFFTQCFKKVNGITPKAYVISKRIDKAIRLIKSTDMTMLEIATHCGFNNSASFNKTFTKTTGKKPTEYRKAYEKH